MPEAPEVETLRRDLSRSILRRSLQRIDILDPTVVQGSPSRWVGCRLSGAVVQSVGRKGKYLIFDLSQRGTLLCHLRMTGRLTWGAADPRARAVLHFQGTPAVLSFSDVRRFGRLWWRASGEDDPALLRLGPDPQDPHLDGKAWATALRKKKNQIHAALLDQRVLAGVGNIYAQEALFSAGVRPTRRVHTLSVPVLVRLLEKVKEVLKKGEKRRGVSFRDYRDLAGRRGRAGDELSVYGRGGEPCGVCRRVLSQSRVGGRGVVWCGGCQA